MTEWIRGLNLTDEQQKAMQDHIDGLNKLTKKYESPIEKKDFLKQVSSTLATWGLETEVPGNKLSVAVRLLAAVKAVTE